MKRYASHINDFPWQTSNIEGWDKLRWKNLLDQDICNCSEFVFGYAELAPGASLPLHAHRQAECAYILSGRVWARLGKRRVELEQECATYFPAGMPHAYEVIGNEPLCYVYTYASEKARQPIDIKACDEKTADQVDIINLSPSQWAVAEDFEPWEFWEPSKGPRGNTWKSLFNAERGGLREMMFGTLIMPPGTRYSLHFHKQPELFYGLSGSGELYICDQTIDIIPGKAFYVPKEGIHGMEPRGAKPLNMIWVYGTETAGKQWSWTPIEDICLYAKNQ